jgi:hypothetical protein
VIDLAVMEVAKDLAEESCAFTSEWAIPQEQLSPRESYDPLVRAAESSRAHVARNCRLGRVRSRSLQAAAAMRLTRSVKPLFGALRWPRLPCLRNQLLVVKGQNVFASVLTYRSKVQYLLDNELNRIKSLSDAIRDKRIRRHEAI